MDDAQQSTSSGVRRSGRKRTFGVAAPQKPIPSEPSEAESSEQSELSGEECSKVDETAHRAKCTELEVEVSSKRRVTSARRKESLSLLPAVPFDVLMEVRILYSLHLCICNTRSQTGVSTPESNRYHRLVPNFERIQGPSLVEEVDFNLSEPAYAVLLFGAPNCYDCGRRNIYRIDFGLRRRLCLRCMRVGLVFEKDLNTDFPGSDPMLLELIPYTHYCTSSIGAGYACGYHSTGRFFHSDDIVKMRNNLEALERAGDPTATNEFLQAQRDKTSSIVSTVHEYESWLKCRQSLEDDPATLDTNLDH
ncbi:hypothetical protein PC9H_009243 [Pleurotus ostreatus]|uniref:Uncharacterized protein n=1 Tax=Pleurotus ostreatus TaxID=5322 RepID=A0A8H6ZLD3_PLEOS|nr:uncharacterized protein PC9H_009243 [Pleurotus ostreatus]KAF7423945.1 hypothetical protein PC9H_009243 [Pleurotus ostreatus]